MLDTISKPQSEPVIMTITGDAGVGKTSLAATFPKPIFIRAEDGLESLVGKNAPDAFPLVEDTDALWAQLASLINEEHEYQTCVIDSSSQLEVLFSDFVLASDPKKPTTLATANGGYGAGYLAVSALHGRVRKAAQLLRSKRGMNVVFIAHSDVATLELPDQDPYSKYELRLNKKCVSHYVDNVDAVAFVKLETFVKDSEKSRNAKALSTGARVVVCYATAANVSKNRYGISEDIYFTEGVNPFVEFVPYLKKQLTVTTNKKAEK